VQDVQWAETGDRYLLKLFRDFIFHQVDEQGGPAVSWGHVIDALNKLDVGSPDRIILLSRNEIDMLITTYADMKRCLDTCYQEIMTAAGPGGSVMPGSGMQQAPATRQLNYFR
jgi:PAB-dependent poly(A)-specific ribonuclease subunit 3